MFTSLRNNYFLATLALGFVASLLVQDANACAIKGPENAPITIQEFVDFQCHYCKKGAATMQEILKNYPTQVKLVLRNLPLHQDEASILAAKAYAAVVLQNCGLAYDYQLALFENQDQIENAGETFLIETAEKLGINGEQMRLDMNGDAVAKSLAEDKKIAEAHGFGGTPSFLVGPEEVTGAYPYADFKKIIDKQLSADAATNPASPRKFNK